MPWVKLDDHFPDHPKVESLSDGAFRLHVSGMCHAARHLSDGRIRPGRVSRLMDGYKPRYLDELLTAGVWERNGTGYLIHDFTEWNKTKQWWDSKREADAQRLAEWRLKQAQKRGD